jgi:hypothetical protein
MIAMRLRLSAHLRRSRQHPRGGRRPPGEVSAIAIKRYDVRWRRLDGMTDRDDTCWFCNPAVRGDPPAGGWLLEDATWRAGHVPAGHGPAGTVVLETRRHVLDQAGFDDAEATTCAEVTGRLVTAVRQATGCDRVYQWATMDAYAHFHLWLVPWSRDDDLRGPRFLADRLVNGDGCDQQTAVRTAESLRDAMASVTR